MKMALSFNTKPQNEIFITSLFEANKKWKIPREKPPTPPPPPPQPHTHLIASLQITTSAGYAK